MPCVVDGCEKPAKNRGWCAMHYTRWLKYGDPLYRKTGPTAYERRFWPQVQRGAEDECWPWLGSIIRGGYGRFNIGDGFVVAHRFVYQLLVGPIPEGFTLDHTCHTRSDCTAGMQCLHRRCVNPAHLEPVSRGDNVLRGRTLSATNAAKTHCIRGHLFDEENTLIDPPWAKRPGRRRCRACAAARHRERKGL